MVSFAAFLLSAWSRSWLPRSAHLVREHVPSSWAALLDLDVDPLAAAGQVSMWLSSVLPGVVLAGAAASGPAAVAGIAVLGPCCHAVPSLGVPSSVATTKCAQGKRYSTSWRLSTVGAASASLLDHVRRRVVGVLTGRARPARARLFESQ